MTINGWDASVYNDNIFVLLTSENEAGIIYNEAKALFYADSGSVPEACANSGPCTILDDVSVCDGMGGANTYSMPAQDDIVKYISSSSTHTLLPVNIVSAADGNINYICGSNSDICNGLAGTTPSSTPSINSLYTLSGDAADKGATAFLNSANLPEVDLDGVFVESDVSTSPIVATLTAENESATFNIYLCAVQTSTPEIGTSTLDSSLEVVLNSGEYIYTVNSEELGDTTKCGDLTYTYSGLDAPEFKNVNCVTGACTFTFDTDAITAAQSSFTYTIY